MHVTVSCMDCPDFEAETDVPALQELPALNRVKGFREHHDGTGPMGHKRYMATIKGRGTALVTRGFPLIVMLPEGSLREGVSRKLRESR